MMKMSLHEIVLMTAVRNRFMPAAGSMRMLAVVRAARMSGGTSGRIRATLRQTVFIHVPLMGTVKMPVMHIVDVTFVLYADMPAARTVSMRVLVMRFVVAHLAASLLLMGVVPIDYRNRFRHRIVNPPPSEFHSTFRGRRAHHRFNAQ
jgi:hypothetical protein